MYRCHACKNVLDTQKRPGRREECPYCRSDLHCCLNCGLYDPGASKQCREPVAEPVKTKDRANFCDYFVFREASISAADGASKARQALDDLFRK